MAERKMSEVQDPNAGKIERLFAKFEKFGDAVEGFFARLVVEKGIGFWDDGRKKQDRNVYEFLDETGGVVAVTGSADIDAKMALVPVGVFTRIEYAMDRPLKNRDKAMKVFRVTTCGDDRKSEAQIASEYHTLEAAAKAAADSAASGSAPF